MSVELKLFFTFMACAILTCLVGIFFTLREKDRMKEMLGICISFVAAAVASAIVGMWRHM